MANNHFKLANEWFKKAKADIDFAKIGFKETEHYGQVCFLCQQAAEKYLKGFLVSNGIRPPKIHSVATLTLRCARLSQEFKDIISYSKILDRYYIPTRYPITIGLTFKKEDAQEALHMLTEIIKMVENNLK